MCACACGLSQALEHRSLQLFRLLLDKYHLSLQRDPYFPACLSKIEQSFFATNSGGAGLGGLLGNLLKGLTELEEDDDDDDDEEGGVEEEGHQ